MKLFMSVCMTFFIMLFFTSSALAERCATPEEVIERKISPDFEWSVSEGVTLEGILSVRRLYAVTIENYGEFVACKYEANQQYIRLDGAPKNTKCPIQVISDNWFVSELGQTVCEESDITLCRFGPSCT
ncbi:MAG: hypothetical protein HN764_10445 [Gammaproteobacteria bacterium]|jgi:hypothetical protein|nr:hypothetical protein [Gammaproteobacteria bacterium]